MANTQYERTSFRYDTVPWKLVLCGLSRDKCEDAPGPHIMISDLIDAPEPGRVPAEVDHLHVVAKFSGDRDARDEEKWRAIAFGAGRCEHGRAQLDTCTGCPDGIAPDRSGARIGTAYDGTPVVVPPRGEWRDIRAWTPDRKRS